MTNDAGHDGTFRIGIDLGGTKIAGILFDTWLSETDLNALLAES